MFPAVPLTVPNAADSVAGELRGNALVCPKVQKTGASSMCCASLHTKLSTVEPEAFMPVESL